MTIDYTRFYASGRRRSPVLAALLVFAAVLLFSLWPTPPAAEMGRYVTHLNATGFQPVTNGEARVVRVEEMKQ
jgi:hypothetical protein